MALASLFINYYGVVAVVGLALSVIGYEQAKASGQKGEGVRDRRDMGRCRLNRLRYWDDRPNAVTGNGPRRTFVQPGHECAQKRIGGMGVVRPPSLLKCRDC